MAKRFKDTPEYKLQWLRNRLRVACRSLGIRYPERKGLTSMDADVRMRENREETRVLAARLKAEAPPDMLEKVERDLGLAYEADGTPYQDPAKKPRYTPENYNPKGNFSWSWPRPDGISPIEIL